MDTYEYKTVNLSHYRDNIEYAANEYAKEGWRVVGIKTKEGPGYANVLILERSMMHIRSDFVGVKVQINGETHVIHPEDVQFIYIE